jgi:transglutaminase-like putative cysteine protease
VRYRLAWKPGADPAGATDDALLALATGTQSAVGLSGGAVELTVARREPGARPGTDPRIPPAGGGDAARPEDLAPNPFVQSDDPRIAEVAGRIAPLSAGSGPAERWQAAKALERWVYDHVAEKNLHTAFASAAEVFEERAGDCTEHAVLLAALTRAAGVPSRLVAGLLYSRGSFVGHMWTEVYCGDGWYPLDAVQGLGGVGPDHVALAHASLADGSISDLFLGLLPVLGRLDLEVLEVVP